jgi:hypothetical protein
MLVAISMAAGSSGARAMGGGGMGGGMGPGWGIDYGQPSSATEAKQPVKPTHRTKSVKRDHKHIVTH